VIDRESAYEILEKREEDAAEAAAKLEAEEAKAEAAEAKEKEREKREKAKSRKSRSSSRRSGRMTNSERATSSAVRYAAREVTKYVLRGILGGRKR